MLVAAAAVLGDKHFGDRALPCYIGYSLLFLRAAILHFRPPSVGTAAADATSKGGGGGGTLASRAVAAGCITLGALISLVLPTLGLMDLGTPNMCVFPK